MEESQKSGLNAGGKIDRTVLSIVKNVDNMGVFSLADLMHAYEELSEALKRIG